MHVLFFIKKKPSLLKIELNTVWIDQIVGFPVFLNESIMFLHRSLQLNNKVQKNVSLQKPVINQAYISLLCRSLDSYACTGIFCKLL